MVFYGQNANFKIHLHTVSGLTAGCLNIIYITEIICLNPRHFRINLSVKIKLNKSHHHSSVLLLRVVLYRVSQQSLWLVRAGKAQVLPPTVVYFHSAEPIKSGAALQSDTQCDASIAIVINCACRNMSKGQQLNYTFPMKT